MAIEHILLAVIVAIPPTIASLCSVAIAFLAYMQSKQNTRKLESVERNTNGLAVQAIVASKEAGRSEGIKEEMLRKSVIPPTTPGFP